jgi:hypothetical protein
MSKEKITTWLDKFREAWLDKDLDLLEQLFDENVEYWESPFRKLDGVKAMLSEWEAVKSQQDIVIDTDVLMVQGSQAAVQWHLSYVLENIKHVWAGVYVIRLRKGICSYFYQVGEAMS